MRIAAGIRYQLARSRHYPAAGARDWISPLWVFGHHTGDGFTLLSLFSVMTKDIHDCNSSPPETMLVSSRHCFYIQSCFVIGSIKYISIMYMCFPCREQSRTISDFRAIVTISGLTHENLSRSRCDFSFKAGFTLVRSDIACDSHRCTDTNCMAGWNCICTKMVQDPFCWIAWVFTPMQSDSCSIRQFALRSVNRFWGGCHKLYIDTPSGSQMSVWTSVWCGKRCSISRASVNRD